jgi:hypothetical protein
VKEMSSLRYVIENIYDEYDRNPSAISYARMIVLVREMMEDDNISASLISNIYDDIVERDEISFAHDFSHDEPVRKDFFDNEDYEEYIFGTDDVDQGFERDY